MTCVFEGDKIRFIFRTYENVEAVLVSLMKAELVGDPNSAPDMFALL
jgi:hypothetical protein